MTPAKFFLAAVLLLASAAFAVTEKWNKGNFEIIFQYPPPANDFESYRSEILKGKLVSFSNVLEDILSRKSIPRLHIIAGPPDKFFFDENRMEIHLPVSDDFNIENGISLITRIFRISEDSSLLKDYFGTPCRFRDGFLFGFQRAGKFYLSFEDGEKLNLLLEENEPFDSVKAVSDSVIMYRSGNSLWVIDVNRKKNFCYFSAPVGFGGATSGGVPFMSSFDCDGENVAVCVCSGEKSHIILGKIGQRPDIFFQDLPYKIEKIFINGETIAFFATLDSGKKVVGIGSQRLKKISRIYSFGKNVLPLLKYKKGLLIFSPGAKKLEYIDADRSVLVTSKIRVKTIPAVTGVKYLAALRNDFLPEGIKKDLLSKSSERVLFLKDVNHLNFILKDIRKKVFYSFHPVSSEEYFLLEAKNYLRSFSRCVVSGLLTKEQLLFNKQNRRRKISLGISGFFIVLLTVLQGAKNVKKKKETV
ncbi:MAG: hypothetical protein ABIH68_03460 [bacterium]